MDRKIEKKSLSAGKIAVIVLGALPLVYVLYMYVFSSRGGSSTTIDASRVTISQVQEAPFEEFITVNATVIPIRSIFLDAVEGGRTDRVLVEGGSFVEEGDTILVMSNNNLQLDVMNRETHILEQMNTMRNTRLALQQQRLSLRSEVLTHETELKQRRREFSRDSSLYASDLVSVHQFEESQQKFEQVLQRRDLYAEQLALDSVATENELQFIEQSLANMRNNLKLVAQIMDNLVIRAPISGQLTSLDAEIGETKSGGQRIGQIDVLDGYKIRAIVDEVYIARVEAGQRANFDFAGRTYELEISRVHPEVVDGRFQVDLDFVSEHPESIRRGQSVRPRLTFSQVSDALLLPRGAFFQRTGGNWVYVLEPGGESAIRRNIQIGRQNSQFYVIEYGLQPGDQVITSSYDAFGNHDKLNLRSSRR